MKKEKEVYVNDIKKLFKSICNEIMESKKEIEYDKLSYYLNLFDELWDNEVASLRDYQIAKSMIKDFDDMRKDIKDLVEIKKRLMRWE